MKRRLLRRRLYWTLLLPAFLAAPVEGQVTAPPDLDSFVAAVQETFEVPGLALAIVKDGKVVVAKGFGVRTLGEATKVDAQTRFGIASNTKAFTATALGLLVEEGKLGWEDRVVDHLPWFQLSDPYVTRELTIRDLLVHRSGLGLGAGDLLWWPPSTYDRKEIARRLRHLPLATSFRSAYAYDNVLYLVAGEVIEAKTGLSWEDFVGERILKPVGMTSSNVRHSDADAVAGANVATPHARVEGVVRPVKPFASDNTNPAGGINSGAADMAKWLITQLDSGRVATGGRLFPPSLTKELWTLVTPMPIGYTPPSAAAGEPNFLGYALGFRVQDYRGHKLVSHTGGLPGYVSEVMMIPDLKLGVAVLTNQESGDAFRSITRHVLDYYLGASDTDWLAAYRTLMEERMARVASSDEATASARNAESAPSLPLAAYAGTYVDEWYGKIDIELDGDHLVMRFGQTPLLVGTMEHWQYDTFLVKWWDRELRADAFVSFSLTPEGKIEQAKMEAASPSVDFSFDFQDLLLIPVSE